jgi:hypothetical protein
MTMQIGNNLREAREKLPFLKTKMVKFTPMNVPKAKN